MLLENAFEMAASSVRFGAGVTREVGMDLVDLGVRRALVLTDPNLTRLAPVRTVLAALDAVTDGDAARLYQRLGWQRVGVIPGYALFPQGGLCDTTVYYRNLSTSTTQWSA